MNHMIYDVFIVVIGILIFVAGITDIRKKQINRGFLLVLMLVCFAAIPFKEDSGIFDAVGGFLIGLCAIGISMMSREQIGRGDGLVIAAIGLVLGVRRCMTAIFAASFIMCMIAIVVLLLKRGNRHTRLPFLPAVFVGYVLCAG
ncbi:MAG: prepilin peptidase [Lachnospiraceae bacterium]|nr:prepilin peptidase [Lachnospiraceae bacterium]